MYYPRAPENKIVTLHPYFPGTVRGVWLYSLFQAGSQIVGKTRNWKAREKLAEREKGSRRTSSPQFTLVFFYLRAFSIQRTRQSRSLEQASLIIESQPVQNAACSWQLDV